MPWCASCHRPRNPFPSRNSFRKAAKRKRLLPSNVSFSAAKSKIQLLVFDLDGTLIDSKLDLALSVNATLGYLGRPLLEEDAIFSYVGRGAPTLIRKVVGEEAAPAEVQRGLEFFLAYY